MRKYLFVFLSFLVLLASLLFFMQKRSIFYFYVNPYTETSGFSKISGVVLELNKLLSMTKLTVKNDGYNIKYLYQNPYGSGFLKNNSVPNDLDFAVGVDLGTFEYNDKNALDIAIKMMNLIKSFYYNLAINLQFNGNDFYLSSTPISVLARLNKYEQKNINDIISTLDYVIKGKNYVKFTSFDNIEGIAANVVKMPYTLNSNEILLQELQPLIIYSDDVVYNNQMKKFMREISLVPEFYATIKYNNKLYDIELVPEAFKGARLQLSRRCFASTIFADFTSYNFLKSVNWLNNNDDYIKYRMLSYKRHIQEIDRLISAKKSPVKILKRVMQVADIVKPLLTDEEYNKVAKLVSENLDNHDVKLLNDYLTIYSNVANIYRFDTLKSNLIRAGKLQEMHKLSENIVTELEQRKNISKSILQMMKNLNDGFKKDIFAQKGENYIEFLVDFENLEPKLNAQIFDLFVNAEGINEFLALNNKILNNSGYHEVTLYWLSESKIGIIRDDFTNSIKDLKEFAANNDLPELEYVLINKNQLPKYPLKFKLYVHNGSSQNNLVDAFLKDKKNFNIKFKYNFI